MKFKILLLPVSSEKCKDCESNKGTNCSLWKILLNIYENFVVFGFIPFLIVAFWYVKFLIFLVTKYFDYANTEIQ